MIIDLRTISAGSKTLEFNLEEEWWASDRGNDQILGFDTPLQVSAEIYKAGNKYVLNGKLSGGLQVRCDRCLKPYHRDLSTVFEVFLSLPSWGHDKSEIELLEKDMEVDFITGEEIDLGEIIREQIYLSLPMKSLCKEGCMGLCPICGMDLNEEKCQCPRERVHPGFSKLKTLRL